MNLPIEFPRRVIRTKNDTENFLVEISQALHRAGLPAHRLESTLDGLARVLDVSAVFFSTPTSLFIAFGEAPDQRITLLRAEPTFPNLGHLARLDEVARRVASGAMSPMAARRALQAAKDHPAAWGYASTMVAFMVASATASILFSGSLTDIPAAALAGLICGWLTEVSSRRVIAARALMMVATFASTALGRMATWFLPEVHPAVVALTGIIVLVPGLSLTTALVELVTGHLASGVARVANAFLSLCMIGLGMALGYKLVPLGTPLWDLHVPTVPSGITYGVLLITAICFGVLLNANRRDIPIITASAFLAFTVNSLASPSLGTIVGAGLGAFTLGLAGNIYHRLLDRSVMVPITPGVLLLVPGSIGFRSIDAMMMGDITLGIELFFKMTMVAGALAAGIATSLTIIPPRRAI